MRTSYHAFRHLARPESVRGDFAVAEGWLAALHADTMAQAAPIALLDGVPERIAARWPGDRKADEVAGQLGGSPRAWPRPARRAPWSTVTSGRGTCS